jgi:hypothetical protein
MTIGYIIRLSIDIFSLTILFGFIVIAVHPKWDVTEPFVLVAILCAIWISIRYGNDKIQS